MNIYERFGVNTITVTVEWAQKLTFNYTTEVSPLALSIFPGNTTTIIASSQLVLQYNTEYNLSVMAVSPCTNVTGFATATLNYGKMFCMLSSNNHNKLLIKGEEEQQLPYYDSVVHYSKIQIMSGL